ncbi:MAG: bifunctional helix-turn-helix transcriptional regulator/GNAT family N-acetyltransferase [Acidobacteria bacterium]|nr:bifunctional helix-turn-helix transcriptional regulator/GNAT family N-acetyltransferase [Acidobacteriota bacterium]
MARASASPDHRDAVRAFNRFYTRQIGVLDEHLLDSPFSLTEMRVLYELAHRKAPTATQLGRDLGLDAGYLSRILRRFDAQRLLRRITSPDDGRQSRLELTPRGRKAFRPLETRTRAQVGAMLDRVPAAHRGQVVGAMDTIQRLLGTPAATRATAEPYMLRTHRPGDMGWVVHRHGALYWQEWGYNQEFEALVARIVADFLDHFDAKRERCWIAEHDGAIVGSVFLVKKSATVAKLRLLLVEPSARGLGLGRRLVDECIRFAREAGYRKITLWTQSELSAARRTYQRAGFRRTSRKRHHSFGKNLIAEVWDLKL